MMNANGLPTVLVVLVTILLCQTTTVIGYTCSFHTHGQQSCWSPLFGRVDSAMGVHSWQHHHHRHALMTLQRGPSVMVLQSGGGGDDSMDEEALLEYLDQDDLTSGMTFQEYKEQQRREKYLRENPLFQRCSNLDLTRIARAMVLETFSKGDKIVNQGESGSAMYFLKQGSVQAIKLANGTEEVLATLAEEGSVFGELALLFGQPRVASVIATSDCILYRLDKAAFLDSIVESPIWETAKGIILKKYSGQRLWDVVFKVRIDEVIGLLGARLFGRFSGKRLAKTAATFSLGAAAALVSTMQVFQKPTTTFLSLAFGIVAYILN